MRNCDSESVTIEVTSEMIEAGVDELCEKFRVNCDLSDLVQDIFMAMVCAAPQLSQLGLRQSGEPFPPR